MKSLPLRLGVNIDHVATIRNARGGDTPDPLRAAQLAIEAGADGITAHLREDRRHIADEDIAKLKAMITRPLNLEMAATDEMLAVALQTRPHACCLVPERRAEKTTEHGLDVRGLGNSLTGFVEKLKDAGIRVSLFVDPDAAQIEAAAHARADIVEIHTGTYCDMAIAGDLAGRDAEIERIIAAARNASESGLEVHAGHGLTFDTVAAVAAIPEIAELNIGHFLIGEAIFAGLDAAVRRMRTIMTEARASNDTLSGKQR
ncbi:MAG: pyridoxine 5'-phosphate synthase [Hyphomicrobiales bacterium]|nr:pyridoxine 5'-phosphate synthase [Hyphomicrobiales bacterium]